MREFILEEAQFGAPICTRDGKKARLICWDMKGTYKVCALVERIEGIEEPMTYPISGRYNDSRKSKHDLMIKEDKQCQD